MRRVSQNVIGFVIGICVLALALHTFVVMGLVSPVYVSAGSMAPHLLAPHWDVECPACGFRYAVGADAPPQAGRTECPQCTAVVLIGTAQRRRGDKLRVDRATYAFRSPRRWEAVVFRCPQDARTLCVKRVVGLPGETIHFDGGDVVINGKRERKSLDEQNATRVLVHRERAAAGQWQPRTQESDWTYSRDAWRTSTAGANHSMGAGDWLEFRPPGGGPVTDRIAYNAGVPAVENATGDLMLTFRVTAHGSGMLCIDCGKIDDSSTDERPHEQGRLVVGLSLRQRAAWIESRAMRPGGDSVAAPLRDRRQPLEVAVSLFDRQVLVTIDGREAVRQPLSQPIEPGKNPLAIAAVGLDVEIRDLAVWRDLVFTDQPGGPVHRHGRGARWQLGSDEYFVVGDNPAVSDDSRTWGHGPGLPGRLIIGRPL